SDHSAVALVPGRSAGRVALDGDQGAAFDDFDEADVVDRIRVAGELEEDEVTGLRITCVPLAALAVPVAHHHGGRGLRDQRAAPGLGEHPPHEDRAPGDAVPAVRLPVLLLVAVRRALDGADLPTSDGEHALDAHSPSSPGVQSGYCGGCINTWSSGATFSVLTSGPTAVSRCDRSSCSSTGSTAGSACGSSTAGSCDASSVT